MHRLSSLLVVSCALLSTFVLPSLCRPSSSSTSFVVAAPSNALFRDSTRLIDRLNGILLEINSVLDSEDQNEEEEEQKELEDEQSAAEDHLEDLLESDQIIGTINTAEGKDREKTPKQIANDEAYAASKKSVHRGFSRFGRGARNFLLAPIYKAHQVNARLNRWADKREQLRKQARENKRISRELGRRDTFDSKYGSPSRSTSQRSQQEDQPEREHEPQQ